MEINEITHKISPLSVTLHEVTVSRLNEDSPWEYSETGPWFKNKAVGDLNNKFIQKANLLKQAGKLALATSLLCNSAYAIELFLNGIITDKMMESIKEGVVGAGRSMTSIIVIPEQEIVIDDEKLRLSIFIVNCFSYNSFSFIDKNNKDL